MKKVVFSLAALALLVGVPSYAKDKKVVTTTTTRTVDEDTNSGPSSTWLGVSTNVALTGTTTPPITALFAFSDKTALQAYLAIDGTKPNFGFGVGADVKFTVVGGLHKGFHLGAGFGLGTTQAAGTFFANIGGLLGLHFTIVDSVMFIADAGLRVHIQSGATDFGIGAASTNLGASVLFHL